MSHTHAEPRQMPCPDCGTSIDITAEAPVDGAEVRCARCGIDLVVTREYVASTGEDTWRLVQAVADDEVVQPNAQA